MMVYRLTCTGLEISHPITERLLLIIRSRHFSGPPEFRISNYYPWS
jgi:hypothetical protein